MHLDASRPPPRATVHRSRAPGSTSNPGRCQMCTSGWPGPTTATRSPGAGCNEVGFAVIDLEGQVLSEFHVPGSETWRPDRLVLQPGGYGQFLAVIDRWLVPPASSGVPAVHEPWQVWRADAYDGSFTELARWDAFLDGPMLTQAGRHVDVGGWGGFLQAGILPTSPDWLYLWAGGTTSAGANPATCEPSTSRTRWCSTAPGPTRTSCPPSWRPPATPCGPSISARAPMRSAMPRWCSGCRRASAWTRPRASRPTCSPGAPTRVCCGTANSRSPGGPETTTTTQRLVTAGRAARRRDGHRGPLDRGQHRGLGGGFPRRHAHRLAPGLPLRRRGPDPLGRRYRRRLHPRRDRDLSPSC